MRTRRHTPILVAVLCGLLLDRPIASGEDRARTLAVAVPSGPVMDGKLTDPVWQKAPPLVLHLLTTGADGLSTTARVLFDDRNLYVGVDCTEPEASLRCRVKNRDGQVWTDDSVEIYILPHPTVGYKQIVVNTAGVIFDQAFPPGRNASPAWNADVKAAVSVEKGRRWQVEVAVPLKDLGALAGERQTWQFNVARNRRLGGGAAEQDYSWSPLPDSNYHNPNCFGTIEGVTIAQREGGVTQMADKLRYGLQWTQLQEPAGVLRVFPHPLNPNVAWCATSMGLYLTQDNGLTWAAAPGGAADDVGEVMSMAVCPGNPGIVCMGTADRGLYLSTDAGRQWQPVGSKTDRPASSHIHMVDFCPSDPSWRTLLVTHGLSEPGMSISRDLGKTWVVRGTDRFLASFVKVQETIVATGSMVGSEGGAWSIHRSGTDGLRWEEPVQNLRPTEPALPYNRWQFLFATLDRGILWSDNDGVSWTGTRGTDVGSWASLFFTYGPDEKTEILAAYDPHKEGVVLSKYRFAEGRGEKQNEGLYVGPVVKSGASCTANANGTTYYASMNNALWVGRWAPNAQGPTVRQTYCVPSVVRVDRSTLLQDQKTLAQHIRTLAPGGAVNSESRALLATRQTLDQRKESMRFSVIAEVTHPQGPQAVKSVTVDMAGLGGVSVPLLDDGKHGDGAAGDGVYGGTVEFSTRVLENPDFARRSVKGKIALTVKATDQASKSASWTAVIGMSLTPEPVVLFGDQGGGRWHFPASGPVAVRSVKDATLGANNQAIEIAATGDGPWQGGWMMDGGGQNVAGRDCLAFRIRGDRSQELRVNLIEHYIVTEDLNYDEPRPSDSVPLIGGGYLKAIAPEYQEVRIPLRDLLPKGSSFLRCHTVGVAFTTDRQGKPGTYRVADVRIDP